MKIRKNEKEVRVVNRIDRESISYRIKATKTANARAGEAARSLLQEFVESVGNHRGKRGSYLGTGCGENLHIASRLCDYLAKCFQRILKDGTAATVALNLSAPRRGRKHSTETRPDSLLRGREVALAFNRNPKKKKAKRLFSGAELPLFQERTKDLKPNWKMEKAIKSVAKAHDLKEGTIIRDYDRWRKLNMEALSLNIKEERRQLSKKPRKNISKPR